MTAIIGRDWALRERDLVPLLLMSFAIVWGILGLYILLSAAVGTRVVFRGVAADKWLAWSYCTVVASTNLK